MKKEKFSIMRIFLLDFLDGLKFKIVITIEDVRLYGNKLVRQEMMKLRKI